MMRGIMHYVQPVKPFLIAHNLLLIYNLATTLGFLGIRHTEPMRQVCDGTNILQFEAVMTRRNVCSYNSIFYSMKYKRFSTRKHQFHQMFYNPQCIY